MRHAFIVCVSFAVLGLATMPASAHGLLTQWAESAQAIYLPPNANPSLMTIEDRFPIRIAADGVKADTACSGSRWIYDYVHHIAAVYDGGPQAILYIGNPPEKLPQRDLSRLSTSRGVHLGEPASQVIAALKVPFSDVVRTSARRQYLYLERPVHISGQTHEFADISMIVFYEGKVVSVWLAHNEP